VDLLRVIEQKQHRNGLFIVREVDINPPFQCSKNGVMDVANDDTSRAVLAVFSRNTQRLFVC
jgi:hypothetical protein